MKKQTRFNQKNKKAISVLTYSILSSPLDFMLIAITEKGICFVAFDENEKALEKTLRKEFPFTALERNDSKLKPIAQSLLKKMKGEKSTSGLTLDLKPTPFQKQVWDHLESIPHGTVQTYSEVAKALKNPKAFRAVARACANNPVAGAIACHRVVGKNGKLSGYRWGIKRKQVLLEMEKAALAI